LKPSEVAPNVSAVIKKFMEKYLDQDYIRCIEGGIDVAVELNKQKLDLICFTGSTMVGKIIAGVAAKNLTPCILELGGKCPAIVHETADIGSAVDKICSAKFSNSGQTCLAPDYVFVHESQVKRFTE
jgi:aldehyde dehydrogenase (NAD+)